MKPVGFFASHTMPSVNDLDIGFFAMQMNPWVDASTPPHSKSHAGM
jgi:hypothetical protein